MTRGARTLKVVTIAGISFAALGASVILISALLPPSLISLRESEQGGRIFLKGQVDLVLYGPDGGVKDERHIDNLIVDTGLEGVASRIAPHDGSINPSSAYNYIALGTASTAVSASQTALVSELPAGPSYSRQQDTQATYSTTSGAQLALSVVYPPGQGTGTINESGLFNANTVGDMLARQVFSTINKGASDTLTVTWTITLSTT